MIPVESGFAPMNFRKGAPGATATKGIGIEFRQLDPAFHLFLCWNSHHQSRNRLLFDRAFMCSTFVGIDTSGKFERIAGTLRRDGVEQTEAG